MADNPEIDGVLLALCKLLAVKVSETDRRSDENVRAALRENQRRTCEKKRLAKLDAGR